MPPIPTTPTRRRIFPHSHWRPGKARTGKIARLPQKLRESVNQMLLDGFTYQAIIAGLGPEGRHLNYHSLKRWRQGGYQDWLIARQRADLSQLKEQFARKLISQTPPQNLPSALTNAIGRQYLEFLVDFDVDDLKQHLQLSPVSYISLLNSLARTSHQGLACANASLAPPAPLPSVKTPSNA